MRPSDASEPLVPAGRALSVEYPAGREPRAQFGGWQGGLALFLISAAALALQVLQTRILSVQMWHHHSYMVVTMTLLGWAAAGALVTVRPGLVRGAVGPRLAWCGSFFALATILGFMLLARTADLAADMTARGSYFELSLFYSFLLVPYFFAGLFVTLALTAARDLHRSYFVNLAGSALGAWVFIAAIEPLGAERLLVLCAAAGPLAALLSAHVGLQRAADPVLAERAARASWMGAWAALSACALLFFSAQRWLAIEVASSKAEALLLAQVPEARLIDSRWTPLCRLDLVQLPDQPGLPGEINIYQDGDAITVMHSDASWERTAPVSLNTLAYIPHLLAKAAGAPGPDVLAIGIGGGIDLRYALDQGASKVLGIEINPTTVRLVGSDYARFNNYVYHRPGVTVEVGEGRSTLRRLDERFNLIQLSGTDTYTAGNAGAYVLSESYLYTREALGEYFDHLLPGGTLGIIRLDYDPPRESLRLFAIALEELRARGVKDLAQHAVVIQHEASAPGSGEIIRFSGCVFSFDPLPERALELYRAAEGLKDYRVLHAPGMRGDPAFAELAAAIAGGTEQRFYESYPWVVRPIGDDSPFFFNFHRWSALFEETDFKTDQWQELTGGPIGLKILAALLVQTSLLTLVLVLLPLWWLKRAGLAAANAGRHLALFLALGAGFMFLEVSTVQRLVLFLGHPTYSLTVVLFSFLIFAGLGSLWSKRYEDDAPRALRMVALLIALVIGLYALALEPSLHAALALPLAGRILVALLLLAPLNFLMGMPFPLGLSRLSRLAPELVPWALGANGAAGVVASIACIAIAMQSGFRTVSLLALLAYVVGIWLATSGPLAPGRERQGA